MRALATTTLLMTFACTPRYVEQTEEAWMPHASAVEGLEEGEFESDPVRYSSGYVPLRDPSDRPDVTVYGFWPHWGDPLDTLPWDQLTHVAIFSVTLNSDGSLADEAFWTSNVDDALALAAPYGVKIHLTVTSFDDSVMGSVLGSSSKRSTAVANLAGLVHDAGAHGVNIDFEGMDSHLSDELVDFTSELRAAVGEVTLATPAADWNGSYDYDQLAAASDGLFIMGYDYSWSGGDPGPVAPLDGSAYGIIDLQWTLADYLDAGTTPDDLIMGLPLYGRGWSTTNNNVPGDSTGSSWSEVFTEAVKVGIDHGRHYDSDVEVAYAFPSSTSQVFYDDTASLAAKIEWALAEGVAGVGFWALTYDDTDRALWGEIDRLTHATPASTAPVLAPPSPAEAGTDNSVVVSGVPQGHTVHLLQSPDVGTYDVAGCGFAVGLDAPDLLGTAVADAAGQATLVFPVDLAEANQSRLMVAVDVTGCEASPDLKVLYVDPASGGTTPPTGGTVPTPTDDEVCYPGTSGAYDVCATLEPVGSQGSDYDYPSTTIANYDEPTRLLRLSDIPGSTKLAPNFTRDELAQEWKGDWAVVQVHAVERLQDLRDAVGALVVTSGYRSPGYNEGVGGAELSRHMYGDAFDLQPTSVSLSSLSASCTAHGAGFVSVYTSHVHCDWRDDSQEPAFYDDGAAPPPPAPVSHTAPSARVARTLAGGLMAPAEGFDCGEPLREWTAYDAAGDVLETATGAEWTPPAEAAWVEVEVGRVTTARIDL